MNRSRVLRRRGRGPVIVSIILLALRFFQTRLPGEEWKKRQSLHLWVYKPSLSLHWHICLACCEIHTGPNFIQANYALGCLPVCPAEIDGLPHDLRVIRPQSPKVVCPALPSLVRVSCSHSLLSWSLCLPRGFFQLTEKFSSSSPDLRSEHSTSLFSAKSRSSLWLPNVAQNF